MITSAAGRIAIFACLRSLRGYRFTATGNGRSMEMLSSGD